MTIIYVSGSPRKGSNTDYLLNLLMDQTGGEFFKLTDYHVEPCKSCWACRKTGSCVLQDDMSSIIIPKLLAADAIVLGTPVYFSNVTAQLKAFIDRTWSIRKQLTNKVGAAVVVGRRYGAEGAITAINAFFLKHEMIVANRGISGIAFDRQEIADDAESVEAASRLGKRIIELCARVRPSQEIPVQTP